jgi:hypothetical protein
MKAFRRFFKYVLIVSIFLSVLLAGLSYLLRSYFEEELTKLLVSELNKSLVARIDVASVDFSFVESFPRASINFRNIIVYSQSGFDAAAYIDGDKVLAARSISIRFNLYDLYKRNYVIKSLAIENAHLWILIDAKGNPNYKVWKESADTVSSPVTAGIEKLTITNLSLTYADPGFMLSGFANDVDFGGQLIRGELHAQAFLKGGIQVITSGGFRYSQRVPVRASCNMYISATQARFSNFSLAANNVEMALDANFSFADALAYEILLKEANADAASLLWFAPDSIKRKLADYAPDGNFRASGKLTKDKPAKAASLTAQIFCRNAAATFSGTRFLSTGLVNLNLPDISSGKIRADAQALRVLIDKDNWVQGNFAYSTLYGKLPLFSWEADFSINRVGVYSFFKELPFDFAGMIAGNSKAELVLADKFEYKNFRSVNASADIFNASLKTDSLLVSGLNAGLRLHGDNISIPSFAASANGCNIRLSASSSNFSHLFSPVPVSFKAKVSCTSDSLHLDVVSKLVSAASAMGSGDTPKQKNESSQDNFILDLDFKSPLVAGEGFHARQVSASGQVTSLKADINHAEASFRCGMLSSQFVYNYGANKVSGAVWASGIDISKAFAEFNSFGQDYLTGSNIYGSLSGRVAGQLEFDSSGLIRHKMQLAAEFAIDNGRLVNFAPAMAMSKYLSEADLGNISFSRMQNIVSIKDDSLYLPRMEIKSSVADIIVAGRQSLDNEFDYRVQLLLSQVLSARRKLRRQPADFGEVADDGLGRTMIPMRIYGHADDVKVSFDRMAARENAAARWRTQNEELRTILREEFSRENTGRKPRQVIEQSDFEIDWGD